MMVIGGGSIWKVTGPEKQSVRGQGPTTISKVERKRLYARVDGRWTRTVNPSTWVVCTTHSCTLCHYRCRWKLWRWGRWLCTRSSAIAEGPRDASYQLQPREMSYGCSTNDLQGRSKSLEMARIDMPYNLSLKRGDVRVSCSKSARHWLRRLPPSNSKLLLLRHAWQLYRHGLWLPHRRRRG